MSTLLNSAASADTRPAFEVADIVRRYGAAYRDGRPVPLLHQRVMHAIAACRTAALGGHVEQCDRCGYSRPVYNSCRNRHCPKCQALAQAQWLAERQAELLPVGYFHNVFTLPHELNDLLAANPRVLYRCCFAASPRRCRRSRPTRTTVWAGKPASRPCCTPGTRNCCTTCTCIASSPAAPWPTTAVAG